MTASPRSYSLTELSWVQILDRLAVDRRLIVPIGACDQYGPHLPVGASTYVAEALASELSEEFGVLRAPALHYGVNHPGERPYAGATGMREKTLHRLLNDLLGAWEDQGFEEFLLITAHGYDPHVEAIAATSSKKARIRVVEALGLDFGSLVETSTAAAHGGEVLTSLLLHLRPDLVAPGEITDYPVDEKIVRSPLGGRKRKIPLKSRGSLGLPSLASAEKGGEIYRFILEKIRAKLFHGTPEDPQVPTG